MNCFNLSDYTENLDKYIIYPGDIVIGMSGTIKVGFNNESKTCYLNQRVGKFKPDSNHLNTKYLYYILLNNINCLLEKVSGGSVKNISNSDVLNLQIPVPPLPVQEEIVRILDTFTELTAELTARKKQYASYRERLLTFDTNVVVEKHKIKDVFTRLKGTPITATQMKEIENSEGDIKIFAGGKTVINAFEKDIPNANITSVPAVLIQSRGVIDVVYYDKPFTFKNEMWAYTTDNLVTLKYLFYFLKNNVKRFQDIASEKGSMPQISLPVTENLEVPLPPLNIQKKIVDVLDNFDKICTDLSIGLPAEIEARQKEYEFYRNELLSFDYLNTEHRTQNTEQA